MFELEPDETETSPEDRLWQAVLLQYVSDITSRPIPKYLDEPQRELIREAQMDWDSDRRQLQRICSFLGLDFHWIAERIEAEMDSLHRITRRKSNRWKNAA